MLGITVKEKKELFRPGDRSLWICAVLPYHISWAYILHFLL